MGLRDLLGIAISSCLTIYSLPRVDYNQRINPLVEPIPLIRKQEDIQFNEEVQDVRKAKYKIRLIEDSAKLDFLKYEIRKEKREETQIENRAWLANKKIRAYIKNPYKGHR